MEQVDPQDYSYFEVVANGIFSQKEMERVIAGVQHRFRTIGVTASVPHGAPARLEMGSAIFQVGAWRDVSLRLAKLILTDFGYVCRELSDNKGAGNNLPVLWPVRTTLSGRVDHDAVYRIAAFGTDALCLDYAAHVLSGGKRAGYSNVLNLIKTGRTKLLDGHYAILLAEGFMSDKTLSSIEEQAPNAQAYARRAMRSTRQFQGSTLEKLVGPI